VADVEAQTVAAALAVLDARLRRPGAVMDSPGRVRQFLALHLAERTSEGFAVLFLDGQHAVIEFAVMFEGTLTQTSVYPREVVRRALALNAGAVILAHNHPSGNPEPSRADEYLTASLKQALALVEVRVLDHIVIGRLSAVSMAERGMV
jgi:DNA repair protein RadC